MSEPAGDAGPPGGAWSRLHPLTPLLRGGRFLVVVLGLVGQQGVREASLRTVALGLAAVVPVGLLVGFVAWYTTRYRLTATELQVDSGLLQRRSRRVPLARLQSVDVVRSLAARVFGLAELRLEVAGGGSTEAPLAYLSEDHAHRLRARLLGRATRASGGSGAPDGRDSDGRDSDGRDSDGPDSDGRDSDWREPDEAVLVQVPTGALVASVLLDGPAIVTGLLLLAVIPLLLLVPRALPAVLATALPVILGTGGLVVRRLLAEYGFTVAESPDGLRLRHGLLETRAQTIPAGRVQAVRLEEPLLWRRRGWVRVEVDVAGYAARRGEEKATTSALLPVAPRQLALSLVDRVLGAPLPPAVHPAPRSARWRAPLSARRLRIGVDDRHLVATHGVLTTTTDAVPLAKVQSLRLLQGPWQRRLGLASVHVDNAGQRLPGVVARHRGVSEAAALLADLTVQARKERRRIVSSDAS